MRVGAKGKEEILRHPLRAMERQPPAIEWPSRRWRFRDCGAGRDNR